MADSNKKIITGTGKVSFWSGLFKNGLLKNKKVWLIFGAIVVLVAGGLVYNNYRSGSNEPISPVEDRTLTPYDEAFGLTYKGDYDAGQKSLDAKIIQASDDAKQRASLFADKSLLAFNNQRYNEALTFAQFSERLNPTRQSANLLAINYEKLGNNKQAAKYYQLEADRTSKFDRQADPDGYQDLLDKIKELSS